MLHHCLHQCCAPQLPQDDIYSSSFSAAAYLKSVGYDCKRKAYVVGERGIMEELAAVGITSFGGPDHNDLRVDFSIESPRDMQARAGIPAQNTISC